MSLDLVYRPFVCVVSKYNAIFGCLNCSREFKTRRGLSIHKKKCWKEETR
jgi:hypothetical protein